MDILNNFSNLMGYAIYVEADGLIKDAVLRDLHKYQYQTSRPSIPIGVYAGYSGASDVTS